MEDVFNYLIIGAALLIGIVRQFKKEADKHEKASPSVPQWTDEDVETDINTVPTTTPTTHNNGRRQFDEIKSMKSKYQSVSSQSRFAQEGTRSTLHTNISPPQSSSLHSIPEEDSQYAISSAEDARKAIIWSEVLKRKYC